MGKGNRIKKASIIIESIQSGIASARAQVAYEVERDGQIEAADNLLIMVADKANKLQTMGSSEYYIQEVLEIKDLLDAVYRLFDLLADEDKPKKAMKLVEQSEVLVGELSDLVADDCPPTPTSAAVSAAMH
jgi:hypothetical protein